MGCFLCDAPLEASRKKWCSEECKDRWRGTVGSVLKRCEGCGIEFLVPVGRVAVRKFCSKPCAYKHRRVVSRPGPLNPRWRGGRVLSYGENWKRIKKEVRARDEVCTKCGKTPEENGRALDVHHVIPYRFTADHSLANLVALCRSCHMRADDHGRRGSARFAGPRQLSLRPPSRRELTRRRGCEQRIRRVHLQERAFAMHGESSSLRRIARELGVSHQTVANWLRQRGP